MRGGCDPVFPERDDATATLMFVETPDIQHTCSVTRTSMSYRAVVTLAHDLIGRCRTRRLAVDGDADAVHYDSRSVRRQSEAGNCGPGRVRLP